MEDLYRVLRRRNSRIVKQLSAMGLMDSQTASDPEERDEEVGGGAAGERWRPSD